MKKLLIAVVSLGIMIPAVAQITKTQKQAQTVKVQDKKEVRKKSQLTPEKYSERKVEVLDKRVTLTADQKKQAYNAYMENAPKRIGAIGTDAQTISEINKSEEAKIAKILTPAQKEKIQKFETEQKSRKEELSKQRQVNRSAAEANQERSPLKPKAK